MRINNYNVPINIVISMVATSYDEAESTALDMLNTMIGDNEHISGIEVDSENITKTLTIKYK